MNKQFAPVLMILFSSTVAGLGAEPHPLVGTWEKVASRTSTDGPWQDAAEQITMLKHITGTHVSWAIFQNDSKEILAAMPKGTAMATGHAVSVAR